MAQQIAGLSADRAADLRDELKRYATLLAWAKLVYQTANKAIDNCAFSDKDIEGEFFYHLHGAPEAVKGGEG